MEGMEVNVVADDTDTLILLMHHWAESMVDVYFPKKVFPEKERLAQVWRVCDLIAKAGTLVTSFVHSCMECMAVTPPLQLSGREDEPHEQVSEDHS